MKNPFNKQNIKQFLNNEKVHDFLCLIFYHYIKFVGMTSKIIVKGYDKEYLQYVKEGKGTLLCTWHSMIMMAPVGILLITDEVKNTRKLGVLASKHKDGRFISKAMRMFGFQEVLGSTTNKKSFMIKDNGGAAAIKAMVRGLRSGMSFCMAPDGPRGPAKKINGEILNIIKMAGCPLFPATISYKNKIIIKKAWDKFEFCLPFTTIQIELGKPFIIPIGENNLEEEKTKLENEINELVERNKF